MVATPAVAVRIDRSLRSLLAEVEDLPSLATEWDRLPEGERVSIALDWDHLLASYLTELDHAYRAGEMTADQRVRYQTLLRKLRDAGPLMARLDFPRPFVSQGG